MKMSAFSFNSHQSEAGWHKHPDTAWDLKENPHVMACASEEVYRKALKDVAKCCCLRVIGGGNVALLVLIVASALICQQTWIFSSPYLPWGPDTLRQEWSKVGGPGIIPGRHRGQLCARIPSDQCTSIHHCCTLAGQRTNTSGVVEGSNVLITAAKPSS